MEIRIAQKEDIEIVMESRLEMLKAVNGLSSDYIFDSELLTSSKNYFNSDNQTTVLAMDQNVIGCATMCYIEMIPTYSHPTGKRAHLMNVYTNRQCRRQGIATNMITILIREAKARGVTEITLDATELGRPIYENLGFSQSSECMVLNISGMNV